LPVERAGLIPGDIKLRVFLIDPFIAIHSILFWVVIHGVVPPIEQGISFSLVHRISIVAPGIFVNQPAGDIVDVAIVME
jgi:hypothetical protein